MRNLCSLTLVVALVSVARPASAQEAPAPSPYPPSYTAYPLAPPPSPEEKPEEPPEHKRGDFDAGGQLRLPSGPDEEGKFATFNWVALDLEARYFLLSSVSIGGSVPLAVVKPDDFGGVEPELFGGFNVTLDARLPKLPSLPLLKYETTLGLVLTGAYMRYGSMLLSKKDYPLYVGDLEPGFTGGLLMHIKLSSLLDFSLLPTWIYQSGDPESLAGVQIPLSLIVKLGEWVKVSADVGVYTGDDYSFGGDDGGRISAGGALDLKIGFLVFHAGAGVASLLTGGLYPTVGESVYFDLNVKYVK
jgi:hypothetical protein